MMWWLLLAVCATVLAAVAVYRLKVWLSSVSEWFAGFMEDDDGNC
jgi:hypothetical protein